MVFMRPATNFARAVSLLGAFMAIAVLMGLLSAGLLLPAIGSAGTAAREAVGLFEELPGDLEETPLAQQSRIEAANGALISTPAKENRIIVDFEDIAPVMRDAQVAIEDERFYDHGGLDLRALSRALVSNAMSDSTQGGSTLTQQYVKLILQEEARKSGDQEAINDLYARSGTAGYIRKLRELKYAVTLEQRLTKDEILHGYLNLAYYGDRTYGVESAARHYFGVSAKKLTLPQAATLAGVVRAPGTTDPLNNPEAALSRRNVVLDKMYEQSMITEKEWRDARKEPLGAEAHRSQRSCLTSAHPYFCDYVTAWLLQNPSLGATREEREERLTTGGLTVTTTLDPDLSREIKLTTREWTPSGNDYRLGSAAAMVEPGTGKVLAIGQSSRYDIKQSRDRISRTSVNWSVDKRYGGGTGFQIGSVAKAFTVVTALQKGVPVESQLAIREPGTVDESSPPRWLDNPDEPIYNVPLEDQHPAGIFFPEDFQKGCTIGTKWWSVRNADDAHHEANISLRDATADSVNTAFATLASQVGTCDIRDTMTKLGLNSGDGDEYGAGRAAVPATFVLGADDATPLTVASAYATLAAGGLYCPPVPVTRIVDANGKEIPLQLPQCEQVIDPDIAAGANELLQGVVSPTGSGFRAVLNGNRPAGGKTGTSDGSSHTWFTGYTPQISTAVWIGYPNGRNYDGVLRDIHIGDRYVEGFLYGSKLAAPLWKELMDFALEGKPIEQFDKPSNKVMFGEDKPVPNVEGMTAEDAIRTLGQAGFAAEERPYNSSFNGGTVVYSTPGAGSMLRQGTLVQIYVSTGNYIAPPAPRPQPQPQPQPQPPSNPDPPSDDPPTDSPPKTDPPTTTPPGNDPPGKGKPPKD